MWGPPVMWTLVYKPYENYSYLRTINQFVKLELLAPTERYRGRGPHIGTWSISRRSDLWNWPTSSGSRQATTSGCDLRLWFPPLFGGFPGRIMSRNGVGTWPKPRSWAGRMPFKRGHFEWGWIWAGSFEFPTFHWKKGGESILVHVFLIFFNHKGSPWDHQNHQNHQSTVRNVSGTRIGSLENDPGTGIGPPALPSHRRRGADLGVGADRQRPCQWPSQWPFGGQPGRIRPGEWAGFRNLQGSKLKDFFSKDKEHHGASAFFGGPKIKKNIHNAFFVGRILTQV